MIPIQYSKYIIPIIKYGSVLAVISYLAFSVYSSYMLREEIGVLKEQLSTSEKTTKTILERLEQNRLRLKELKEQRIIVLNNIEELKQVEDDDFFNEIYDYLYENNSINPFSLPDRMYDNK